MYKFALCPRVDRISLLCDNFFLGVCKNPLFVQNIVNRLIFLTLRVNFTNYQDFNIQEFCVGLTLHFCFLYVSQNTQQILTYTTLTFRHRASSILGQAFHYSPENAFYIFNNKYISLSDICLTVHH